MCNGSGWESYQRDGSEFIYNCDGDYVQVGEPGIKYDFARRCRSCHGVEVVNKDQQRRAKIPASFYDVTMQDFGWEIYKDKEGNQIDLSKHRELVNSFLSKFREWEKDGVGLYIWGKTRGCGKTFLASAICNELISRYHIRPKFVSVSALINMDKDDAAAIEELMHADVLALDDLGQQNTGNRWVEDILFRILDYRVQNKKVVLVTSNIKIRELNFDDRVADRLEAMAWELQLPDYCARSKESRSKKMALLERVGILPRDGSREPMKGEQLKIKGA